jgi:hypothetical protein
MLIEISDELISELNAFRREIGEDEITEPEELEDFLSRMIEDQCEDY